MTMPWLRIAEPRGKTRRSSCNRRRISSGRWAKRMSSTELPADMGATKHAPIWAVGLAATLLAASFGRRRTAAAAASDQAARRFDEDTPAGGARALADEGRGRAADTPSEIPARGWKDILL